MATTKNKPKSFWRRPEGVTGTIFLLAILGGIAYIIYTFGAFLLGLLSTGIGIAVTALVLGLIIYMVLDPKARTVISYMYKSIMRWITGIFVTIDPIGILKNYVDDLEDNLQKMGKQIGSLRGQMRKLKDLMSSNKKEIDQNMQMASLAKRDGREKQMLLATRKAARLKETNGKYEALHKRMDILYRVLTKMYTNSEILLEDTKDQVKLKEQERKAIRTSHSAMKSAMNVISGNKDQRAIFDQALEVIADDVAEKVGEMERFMELSSNFMDSIDLQNGLFEEQGLKMLEKWERESSLILLGDAKNQMLAEGKSNIFDDLESTKEKEVKLKREHQTGSSNSNYEALFDE
jgi:hypothetical protein